MYQRSSFGVVVIGKEGKLNTLEKVRRVVGFSVGDCSEVVELVEDF